MTNILQGVKLHFRGEHLNKKYDCGYDRQERAKYVQKQIRKQQKCKTVILNVSLWPCVLVDMYYLHFKCAYREIIQCEAAEEIAYLMHFGTVIIPLEALCFKNVIIVDNYGFFEGFTGEKIHYFGNRKGPLGIDIVRSNWLMTIVFAYFVCTGFQYRFHDLNHIRTVSGFQDSYQESHDEISRCMV